MGPLCARHPTFEARWQCARCGRAHCSTCVRRIPSGPTTVEACAHCDGLLQPVEQPTPPPEPLRSLFGRIMTAEGLMTAAAIAAPAWLAALVPLPLLSAILWFVYFVALSGYYFQLVDHLGRGGRGFPFPSTDDLSPFWRGLACLVLLALPYGLASGFGEREAVLHGTISLMASPLIAAIYLPAAILACTLANNALAALWPIFWIQIIARAPGSYARLVGQFVVTGLVVAVVVVVTRATVGRVPFVGALISATIIHATLFAQALVVGDFLRRHSSDFG